MFGMSFYKPVRHLREYLDVLMPLLSGDRVETHGETISPNLALDVPASQPVPVQVAALGPQMLKLAGARTAGKITWMTGPRTIADHTAPTLRAAADQARNPDPFVTSVVPVVRSEERRVGNRWVRARRS